MEKMFSCIVEINLVTPYSLSWQLDCFPTMDLLLWEFTDVKLIYTDYVLKVRFDGGTRWCCVILNKAYYLHLRTITCHCVLKENIMCLYFWYSLFYTYSKKDIELLSKVQNTLAFMLNDENVSVQKRVMLSVTQLYKFALQVGVN